MRNLIEKEITKKIIGVILLIIILLLSITVFSKFATSPENYASTIQSIDDKKATVMGVTATAAITSTALAAIPGDATTPIANQIMDLSSYLLIVVCTLVLEKALLTVMGYLSFRILIPIALIMLGIYLFFPKRILKVLAVKFIVFGLIITTIIPFSMKISEMIYRSNQTMIEQVTAGLDEENIQNNNDGEKSNIDKILNKIKDGVSDVGEKAKEILNNFIDAIALFIITYCVLPIIIVFFVIWFINFLFNLSIPTPKILTKRRNNKGKQSEQSIDEETV